MSCVSSKFTPLVFPPKSFVPQGLHKTFLVKNIKLEKTLGKFL